MRRTKAASITFAAVVLAVCGAGAISWAMHSAQEATQTRTKAAAAGHALQQILDEFGDAETWHQRYLWSSDPFEQEQYHASTGRIDKLLRDARELSAGEPGSLTLLRGLEDTINKRRAVLAYADSKRKTKGLEAALDVMKFEEKLGSGPTDVAQLTSEVAAAQRGRVADLVRDEARYRAYAGAGAVLLALAVAVLAWVAMVSTKLSIAGRIDGDALPVGTLVVDELGRIRYANAQVMRQLSLDAPPRGRIVDMVAPDDRPGFREYLEKLTKRTEGFVEDREQFEFLTGDGKHIPVRIALGDHCADGQRLITVLLRTITGRHQMWSKLRASEARLKVITDNLPGMVVQGDADGRISFHNKALRAFLGRPEGELDGKRFVDVFCAPEQAALREAFAKALAGQSGKADLTMPDAEGVQRDFSALVRSRMADEDGGQVASVLVLMSDVTDLRNVDRMKNEFISTVSHELRTPLTSIRGSLGLLAGGVTGTLPEAAKTLVSIAQNNCERLIRLINDILDIEKIESGKMRFDQQVHALQPLLEQTMAALEGFAAQHCVQVSLSAPAGTVCASVDSDRFAQVMTNLISNAIKFAPRNSTVNVSLLPAGDLVRIEVRDRGPGIPPEFRDRIFQKFSQADASSTREKGGTGLGLSISKAIVERMGGRVGFATEMGVGTCFFVELPATQEMPVAFHAPQPSLLPELPPASQNAPRLLVCEDDPDIARLICLLLQKGGYQSSVARTAAEARALLRTGGYAAMTVDLALPDEDGISLIRSVRAEAKTRKIPVIVISARADEERVSINSQALSVTEWLGKPIDEVRLMSAVWSATSDGRGEMPRVLHVEDDPDLQRVARIITQDFAHFEFAGTLTEARERLDDQQFDLVVLDLSLPDGSGWDLLPDVMRQPRRPRIVVFSASERPDMADRYPIDAFLVKGSTSNDQLLDRLKSLLGSKQPESLEA